MKTRYKPPLPIDGPVLAIIERAADAGDVCPSYGSIGKELNASSDVVGLSFRRLECNGMIVREQKPRGVCSIVRVVSTGRVTASPEVMGKAKPRETPDKIKRKCLRCRKEFVTTRERFVCAECHRNNPDGEQRLPIGWEYY